MCVEPSAANRQAPKASHGLDAAEWSGLGELNVIQIDWGDSIECDMTETGEDRQQWEWREILPRKRQRSHDRLKVRLSSDSIAEPVPQNPLYYSRRQTMYLWPIMRLGLAGQ
ncbi:hypothetical protein BD311DRAFT_108015 [Dichomitus squalens]|uniref:Uncharacterized protein n=1 Tax=Dichomitus squalens TaxID=114155 RepID=A0A4V2JYY7_9APHY|nr:hypothetical protein BD311DRAFT_108015 [Dichomitus squalens]